jgi:hypothetical protein
MSNNQIQGTATIPAASSRLAGEATIAPFVAVRQEAEQEAVQSLFAAASPQPELSGTGFTYRHDWVPCAAR